MGILDRLLGRKNKKDTMHEKEEYDKNKLKNEFDYKLLDTTLNSYKEQYSRFKDIDTKAIGIITITGILITFLRTGHEGEGFMRETFHNVTSLSFLIAILFAIFTIATRKYEVVSVYKIMKELSPEYNEKNLERMITAAAEAEKSLCKVANDKAKLLRHAIYMFGAGTILLIFGQLI